MTKLNYGDVSDIAYSDAAGSIVLSPEQQSLAVQAVSIFRELYNWTDGETEGDEIEALVSDTIAALTGITIPPREDMNNIVVMFPSQCQVGIGNVLIWNSARGTFEQSSNAVGNYYYTAGILNSGTWEYLLTANRGSGNGKVQINVKDHLGTLIDTETFDLYNSTTQEKFQFVGNVVLTAIDEYIIEFVTVTKNASSSGNLLPIHHLTWAKQ